MCTNSSMMSVVIETVMVGAVPSMEAWGSAIQKQEIKHDIYNTAATNPFKEELKASSSKMHGVYSENGS